jgi:mono/diheme cytochrome c family protein
MIKKILLGLLAIIFLVALSFYFYVQSNWNIKYDLVGPALKASTDSAIIARGRYLVKGPAHCVSCHVSTYEEMIKSDQGAEIPLKGGVLFPMGPLGVMSPPNLTPDPTTGIGRYTDAQLFRMMRHAIKPDSTSTMSLLMPFYDLWSRLKTRFKNQSGRLWGKPFVHWPLRLSQLKTQNPYLLLPRWRPPLSGENTWPGMWPIA